MAAKGQKAKEQIAQMILDYFPGSFRNDKDIRINHVEDGTPVQIKIVLTAVKVPISDCPKNEVINEETFFIGDDEKADLKNALEEMGVI